MKKLLFFVLTVLGAVGMSKAQSMNADELQWKDATELTVLGKIVPDTFEPFSRLPVSLRERTREPVWKLGRNSAGLCVKFATDAKAMSLRWSNVFGYFRDNICPVNAHGLDVYVWQEGGWRFLGATRIKRGHKLNVTDFRFDKLGDGLKEFMVYLSTYDGVEKLEIGIPKGGWIEPSSFDSPRARKPVIMYGTSILQGGSASRPGLIGSNRLERMLDRQVINLGFSGNAHLDLEIAELMASYPDPGVFVLDNLPNCGASLIKEKQEAFFRVLRDAHPKVPVVFVENPYYPRVKYNAGQEEAIKAKNQALREVFGSLKKAGEKNIYYVKGDKLLPPDGEGTVDGTHFTDQGFESYVSVLYPVLNKICKKL